MVIKMEPPELNMKDALRYSGCKGEGGDLKDTVYECFDEIKEKIDYKVCYEIKDIKREGNEIFFGSITTESDSLHRALSDCDRVLIFAATVGAFMDRAVKKYEHLSPGKALIMQGLGAERVESLCDVFCKKFDEDLKKEGCRLLPRVSPGYGDMPLSMQPDVFKMLDLTKMTGITLNENNFMIPTKSVTAFAGISKLD